MTERPILFSGPMVRAILEGRKTQTRRVVKPQPEGLTGRMRSARFSVSRGDHNCPYGQPGDRLWVRETWCGHLGPKPISGFGRDDAPKPERTAKIPSNEAAGPCHLYYRSTFGDKPPLDWITWKPSIHMPRWASRLTLEVTAVRVERLQEISKDDALAEGMWLGEQPPKSFDRTYGESMPVHLFGGYWDHVNAKRGHGWDTNPLVWVVEFTPSLQHRGTPVAPRIEQGDWT